MEYKPTNREKRLKRKHGLAYCFGCDRALVTEGKRCPVCGNYYYPRRINPGKRKGN